MISKAKLERHAQRADRVVDSLITPTNARSLRDTFEASHILSLRAPIRASELPNINGSEPSRAASGIQQNSSADGIAGAVRTRGIDPVRECCLVVDEDVDHGAGHFCITLEIGTSKQLPQLQLSIRSERETPF